VNDSARLRRWIIGGGIALILAFVALTAYDAWRLHRQVEESTTRELSNMARALAQESERSLQAVDLLLTDIAIWYHDKASRLSAQDIENGLRERVAATPQVSIVSMSDRNGMQTHRSRNTGFALVDISDRDYFQHLRQAPQAGLYINAPIVTRSEGRPSLVVARRLETPAGEFAGVIAAAVALDELRAVYDALDLGKGSSLLLTFTDGTVIVRQPFDLRAEGHRFANLAALQHNSAPRLTTSPLDGRLKYIVSLPVPGRPLIMSVTRDAHDALAPWRAELVGLVGRAIAMTLATLLTMRLMLRQLARIESGERALRHSEQRYALAMDAANEGHAEWDMEHGTFFASERWLRLHELGPEQMPAQADALLSAVPVHPDDQAEARLALDEHLTGCKVDLDLEYRVRLRQPPPDGPAWRWIHARGRCQRGPDGQPTRFYSAAMDVTARKAGEQERERLQTQLRQAQHLEALGTLAGGIAHDFNNILGAILGHGEMAQRLAEHDARLARHLDRIMQAGGRAKLLVRRILEFSRSGVRDRALVNVERAAEDALQLIIPTLPLKVRLHTELACGRAAVLGDVSQIHQLLSNLCSNAVGAMPDGGLLGVSVRCRELAQPQLLSHGQLGAGTYVCIEVSDEGCGLSPEVYARMFDPFYSTKPVGEGTGLGLSVVHSIVADMAGAIDVHSEPGRGSRFTLWLPVAGEADPARSVSDAEVRRGDGQVVMIVDDEAALVESAEEMLAEMGYEPVGFSSGTQALAAFEDAPDRFDLVVTDHTMPGLSGIELTERLHARRPELPVVVMSGYGDEALALRARAAGAWGLVRKPLSAADLGEAVAAALRPVAQQP